MPNAPPGRFPELRKTAPRHITWHKVKAYTAIYRRGRTRVTIKTISEPPEEKVFRTSRGLAKFKRVKLKVTTKEVIIVARTKGRKKPVDTEELEELEALEELEDIDELEDEDEEDEELEEDEDDEEPEDEEEEDEDEEDEEPAPKRSRAKKAPAKKSSKPQGSRAAANGKVGTQEVAAHFGVDARTLRMVLRKHSVPKDSDSNRYEWSSLKHPQVVKIGKLIKGGEAKKVKQEGLDRVKSRKAGKTTAKKTTTRRKRRASEDDED